MPRHRSGRPDVLCASDMFVYQKGLDSLCESGLPNDVVVSGVGILGDTSVVLQARQRAQQYQEAAARELELADRVVQQVAERVPTLRLKSHKFPAR